VQRNAMVHFYFSISDFRLMFQVEKLNDFANYISTFTVNNGSRISLWMKENWLHSLYTRTYNI
jgi:hypothetical protein